MSDAETVFSESNSSVTIIDLTGLGFTSTMEVERSSSSSNGVTPDVVDGQMSPAASQSSQDSCHSEDAELKGYLDVRVKPCQHRSCSASMDEKAIGSYEMSSRPRGVALVIAMEKFENEVHDERWGSEVDRANLKELFKQLHFEVIEKLDLTKPEFYDALMQFAENEAHEKADMMILCILSHGKEGGISTTTGLHVDMESIFEKFNNQSCPMLKGKPKFFIIQACRGDTKDYGTRDAADADAQQPEEGATTRAGGRRRNIGADNNDSVPFKMAVVEDHVNVARPTWEDMVIAYSTIPGFQAIRDHNKGTWFIQSLVEVFMNHAADRELIDLLRMTSQRLSQFVNDNGEKQTCNIELRHLYKRLYFNPEQFAQKQRALAARGRSSPMPPPRRDTKKTAQ